MNSILFLLRSFNLGGAERQLILLAAGLQQSGYSVKVAVFYAGGPLEPEAKRMGVQVIDLKRRGRWDLLPFFSRLIGLIKREKPDILHSYLQVPNIWSALIKLVLPRAKVVWGIRASNVDMRQYGWQWQLTDFVEYLLSRIPDWIICNSHAGMLHAVKRGYRQKRISVIHNGIDIQRFFPERRLGLPIRQKWGIQPDHKLIGLVGRLDPMKDHANFLRAASWLRERRTDLYFVCVGGGPENYVQQYRELACSLKLEDCLIWTEEQEDMTAIYNAFDILVLSSAYGEGFSNALGEGMACGIPCIATNVGDTRHLIGDTGEVVLPGNDEALAQGILRLLDRLEKEGTSLKHKVVQRIMDEFSVTTLVSYTAATLTEVFNGKGSSKDKMLQSNLEP